MKKFSFIAILLLILSGTALSAEDFDWSECWCNYGGGIEKGDVIINIDGGLYYSDFAYAAHDGFWFFPPVMFEIQFAQPIWKLPFTPMNLCSLCVSWLMVSAITHTNRAES